MVHNGIIESHAELRAELESKGQEFCTETDTETVAQLIDYYLKQGMDPTAAASAAFPRLQGAYALVMIFAGHSELIIGAQHGAPLAVGFGEDAMYVGSDAMALAPLTRRIAYLEDGDWAVIERRGAKFFDRCGKPVSREVKLTRLTGAAIGKSGYRHFMEKELYEHPAAIGDTLRSVIEPARRSIVLPQMTLSLRKIPRISIIACGSAFYAGLVGRWWLEAAARIPTDRDTASEFRYRNPPLPRGGLGLLISQSGETADTLAALRYMRGQGQHIVSIINTPESSMARKSKMVLETLAGPEIGVASTKAFSAQLTMLACLAVATARARGTFNDAAECAEVTALLEAPRHVAEVLACREAIQSVAERVARARDVLYLGRGNCYPIALEGALKLKEISYIHAEGYAAGEMKHGPIALIDRNVPVIALAPSGELFDKLASNLHEAAARGGQLLVFSDAAGAQRLHGIAAETVVLPKVDPFVAPIIYAVAMQLLAYLVAVENGTDVDQPRNLAKSVTVE